MPLSLKRYLWSLVAVIAIILIVMAEIMSSESVFASQIGADSLIGYWKFDETSGTSPADSSGDGRTGSFIGSTAISTTVAPTIFTSTRALQFGATTSDAVSVPANAALNAWTTGMTFSIWFKRDETGTAEHGLMTNSDVISLAIVNNKIYFWLPGQAILQSNTSVNNTNWHHVAGVFDNANNTMKIYLDGVLDNSMAETNNPSTPTQNFIIGNQPGITTRAFSGFLDDVRVYNRALSASDVAELAAGQHVSAYWKGKSGTGFERRASWSGSYIPDPYSRLVVRAASGALTLTGAISFAGLTINTGAIMSLNGTGVTMKDSGTFTNYGTLALKNSETLTSLTLSTDKGTVMLMGTGSTTGLKTGNTAYNMTINDGLLAYLPFDETSGTKAADASGYGNSGALIGGPTISTTVAPLRKTNARSLSFDGSNDKVTLTGSLSLLNNVQQFTLAGWVRPTTAGSRIGFFGQNDIIEFGFSDSTHITCWTQAGGEATWTFTSATFPLSIWHHVACVGNARGISVFVDGNYVAGAVNANAGFGTSAYPFNIGGSIWDSSGNYFTGNIDDVRVYKRALSPGEIAALAIGSEPSVALGRVTLNAALDVNNNLTLNGGTLDVSSANYGITVGGSWLNNGGVLAARNGTVTFDGTSSSLQILSGGQRFNAVTMNGAGATWNLRDRLSASGALTLATGTLDASGSYVIRAGSWTQNGGTFTPRSGTVVLDGSASAAFTPSSAFNILRIEDPTENGLIGYWKFDEGTNTGAILDSSGYGNTGTRRGSGGLIWTGSTLPSLQFDNPLAMTFDGVDDYVGTTIDSTIAWGSSSWTASAWANIATGVTAPEIIGWGSGDVPPYGFWAIYRNSSGYAEFRTYNGGILSTTTTLSAGVWYHLAVRYVSATDVEMFVNGVVVGSSSAMAITSRTGFPVTIGAPHLLTQHNYWKGLIDDVRIYNRALSANEIANLARGRYASGNSSTATHTLAGNLSAATLALDSGNLATSSSTLTVTNALTLLRGGGNLTLGSALASLNGGLTLSGVTLTGASGTLDINGSLLMLTGSLIAPSGTFTVSGNWNKTGGTFTHNSGTVQFDGTNQTLSGSLVFYNLTKTVSSADTFKFAWNGVVSVSGALTLRGTGSNVLTVRSTKSGTKAGLILDGDTGTQTIDYVNVNDNDATGGQVLVCLIASEGCTNGGNTTNWVFTLPTVYFSLSTLTRSETSGSASLLVHLSGTTLLTVTVPYSLGGTATGTGTDYTAFTPSPLIIRAGQTNTGLILLLTDDSDVESDETIILTLGTPTNASLGSTGSSLTLTLTSDDVAASPPPPPPPPAQGTSGGGGGHAGRAGPGGDKTSSLAIAARTAIAERFEKQINAPVIAELGKTFTSSHPSSMMTVIPTVLNTRHFSEQRGRLIVHMEQREVLYKDVIVSEWYAPYVSAVIHDGVAQGYRDEQGNLTGEFGVAKAVTRAEVLKMALEAVGNSLVTKPPRNISAQGIWASPYIAAAEALGLSVFSVDTDVNAPATRGEVMQILLEVMKLPIGKSLATFSDVPRNHPYGHAIATAAFYGLVEGDTRPDGTPQNTFRPNATINRAEVAKVIATLREVLQQ